MKSPVAIWRRQKTNYRNLGAVGRVVSKTRIIETPSGFIGPYWVVLVQLKQGRTVGQWADEAEPKIGMKTIGILRRIGDVEPSEVIEYGVKWKKW
ncbi:hypothetical protein COW80_00295 [Candidatus Beckwithbacteria bacterium CG22_combo_CG10-13_8_21_14_all_01_47_9]|uniref:DUF35 domain-containing protein n=2 Tax=Candidatus Beckwithiibacteriota TaxID=1752726 RepID=A0A2H0E1Y6_9BACT|nr:MAG: hypothetical protein COW80_00295 [Candidatus Beckwithbacteria bacterium CG22_combo_CG10-13_8_21_14_all_01_47_9]